MKILYTQVFVLLLAVNGASTAENAAQLSSPSASKELNKVVSSVAALRGKATKTSFEGDHSKLLEEITDSALALQTLKPANLDIPVAELSLQESKDLVEDLQPFVETSAENFQKLLMAASEIEGLEWLATMDISRMNGMKRSFSNLISLLEGAIKAESLTQNSTAIAEVREERYNDRRKRRRKMQAADGDSSIGRGSPQKNRKPSSAHPWPSASSLEAMSGRKLSNREKNQNDIYVGLQNAFVSRDIPNFQNLRRGSETAEYSKRNYWDLRRRLSQSSKIELCNQLLECVLGMSTYDFFVLTYMDDIDPNTGEIDDQVVRHGEKDIIQAMDTARNIANEFSSFPPNHERFSAMYGDQSAGNILATCNNCGYDYISEVQISCGHNGADRVVKGICVKYKNLDNDNEEFEGEHIGTCDDDGKTVKFEKDRPLSKVLVKAGSFVYDLRFCSESSECEQVCGNLGEEQTISSSAGPILSLRGKLETAETKLLENFGVEFALEGDTRDDFVRYSTPVGAGGQGSHMSSCGVWCNDVDYIRTIKVQCQNDDIPRVKGLCLNYNYAGGDDTNSVGGKISLSSCSGPFDAEIKFTYDHPLRKVVARTDTNLIYGIQFCTDNGCFDNVCGTNGIEKTFGVPDGSIIGFEAKVDETAIYQISTIASSRPLRRTSMFYTGKGWTRETGSSTVESTVPYDGIPGYRIDAVDVYCKADNLLAIKTTYSIDHIAEVIDGWIGNRGIEENPQDELNMGIVKRSFHFSIDNPLKEVKVGTVNQLEALNIRLCWTDGTCTGQVCGGIYDESEEKTLIEAGKSVLGFTASFDTNDRLKSLGLIYNDLPSSKSSYAVPSYFQTEGEYTDSCPDCKYSYISKVTIACSQDPTVGNGGQIVGICVKYKYSGGFRPDEDGNNIGSCDTNYTRTFQYTEDDPLASIHVKKRLSFFDWNGGGGVSLALCSKTSCGQMMCSNDVVHGGEWVFMSNNPILSIQGSVGNDNYLDFVRVGYKYSTETALAAFDKVYETGCDNLLQQFHRTLESDGAWYGATVGEVCLAEGTSVYVNLENMMKTALMDTEFQNILSENIGYLDEVGGELFHCAAELFESEDRKKTHYDESYIFGSCDGGNSTYCSMSEYKFPFLAIAENDDRDEYGQIHGSRGIFEYSTYSDFLESCESCMRAVDEDLGIDFADQRDACFRQYQADLRKPYRQRELYFWGDYHRERRRARDAKAKNAYDACLNKIPKKANEEQAGNATVQYHECLADHVNAPLDKSIEAVFGPKVSPGFVCGVKEAVVNRGRSLPGQCCLDAPYQLKGSHWGHHYDCSSDCEHLGPYFSGLSEESCKAHGGTFCPRDVDCIKLVTCTNEMKVEATRRELHIFKRYLESAPPVSDPTDFTQCGRLRTYFGYDELFIHDHAICDDVRELRFTKNFEFLEEIFRSNLIVDEPAAMEGFTLTPINREGSLAPDVQSGPDWARLNYGMGVAISAAEEISDRLGAVKCEVLPFAGTAGCATIFNMLSQLAAFYVAYLNMILSISEFVFGEKAEVNNIQPVESWEDTQAIFGHMVETGKYIEKGFNKVFNEIFEVKQEVRGMKSSRNLLGSGGEDVAKLSNSHNNQVEGSALDNGTTKASDVENKLKDLDSKLNEVNEQLSRLDGLEEKLSRVDQMDFKLNGLEKNLSKILELLTATREEEHS